MIASSSIDSTVDFGSFGPVGRSATERRIPPLGHGLLVDPVAPGQGPQALLTMLYRSTDRLCRCGAAVKNLAHTASLHAEENSAPSKPGIKHLGRPEMAGDQLRREPVAGVVHASTGMVVLEAAGPDGGFDRAARVERFQAVPSMRPARFIKELEQPSHSPDANDEPEWDTDLHRADAQTASSGVRRAQHDIAATAYCGLNPAAARPCRRAASRSSCPSASSRARQSLPAGR